MSAKPAITISQARQLLQAAGLRRTTCRVAVLQFMASAQAPVTHAEVSEQLVPAGFEKSTIYRSLIEFADAGILNRLDLGDHVWRFELRQQHASQEAEHPHFMCLDCGKVVCLPQMQVEISAQTDAPVDSPGDVTQVLLKGHCADCR